MIRIRESREGEKEELVRCADRAFGDSLPEGGFCGLLPKLYGKDARTAGNHLMAEEDGNILGLLLMEDLEYRVFDEVLPVTAIGTVCVVPEARGRGVMKLLMDEAVRRLREKGCAFAVLGGQRQRYEYWGFHPCGTLMRFEWNQDNLRHCRGKWMQEELELVALDRDSRLLEEVRLLWERQPVRILRPGERFYDILCSWGGMPYALLKDGKVVGYAVLVSEEECREAVCQGSRCVRIQELILEDGVEAGAVLDAIYSGLGIGAGSIAVTPPAQKLLQELEEICETERLECGHKFLILDWPRVLGAMLRVRNSYRPLRDGDILVKIVDESGKDGGASMVHLTVGNGCVHAYGNARGEPAAEFTARKACRILFRHTLAQCGELERLPWGWFPLPLYVTEQDCC